LRVQDGIGAGARRCDRRGGAGRSAAGDQHGATANRPRREQRAIESQRLAVVIPNAALRADGGHSHDARTFRISVEWLAAQSERGQAVDADEKELKRSTPIGAPTRPKQSAHE
jgi:hypothetical protein